jgi:DNA-binding MarR family transcriptional regulator
VSREDFIEDAVAGWAQIYPHQDLEPLALMQRLIWSGRVAEELLDSVAAASGLRQRRDYEVLAVLRRAEPGTLAPAQIAGRLLTSTSGMTGKLDRLEGRGYIRRSANVEDRRTVDVRLTETGRQLVDHTFANFIALYKSILSDVNSADRQLLAEFLTAVLTNVERLSGQRRPWMTSEADPQEPSTR